MSQFIERSLLNVLSTIKENSIKSWGWSNFYQPRWKYKNSKSKQNNDDDDNNNKNNADADDADDDDGNDNGDDDNDEDDGNDDGDDDNDDDDGDDNSTDDSNDNNKMTKTTEEIETDLRSFSKQLNQDLKPRRKIKLLCWASKLVPQSKVRSETYGSFLASGALV